MSVTHKPKAGALLTGTEYEAADAHVVNLTAADVGAAEDDHNHDADYEAAGAVATHSAVTTSVHGITDTSDLATSADLVHDHDAAYEASGAVATHAADTTSVHGITDTSDLATSADLVHDHDADYEAAGAVATHSADTTSVHGIADTSALATSSSVTSAISTHAGEADPHTGYVKENDANWTDLTDGGETALHSHAGGGGGGLFTDMDLPPASPHASNMEGDSGDMASWTWLTSSGSVTEQGVLEQTFEDDSGPAAPSWNVGSDMSSHLVIQPVNAGKLAAYLGFSPTTATNWVVGVKMRLWAPNNNANSDDRIMFGVTSDSTPSIASNEVANSIAVELRTNSVSYGHAQIRPGARAGEMQPTVGIMYGAIVGRADNSIRTYASVDGMSWRLKGSIASGTSPAGAGTVRNIFIYVQDLSNNGQAAVGIVDWIRLATGTPNPFKLGGGR